MDQRQASGHAIAAYRDTLRLLLCFAGHKCGSFPAGPQPAKLDGRPWPGTCHG